MASPSELGLDCKPHSYSMLLKSVGEQSDQTYKLEEFVSRLEEERLKIDAFKRELPLCMQLLTNAMEASKQQLQAYKVSQGVTKPILEEFIPVKEVTSSETMENITNNNVCDKANWMTSAQLWSQTTEATKQQNSTKETSERNNIGFNISPKHRNGGAFLPFSKERNNSSSCQNQGLPELALASNQKEVEDKKHEEKGEKRENTEEKGSPVASSHTQTTSNNSNQTHRKARRCWSPDLHRRFVNALQMLGGSQVATPKQIRELMKVDGLTNDEVKSHLQKYRLHTRRPSLSAQPGAPPAQLVVLGGIWVPPEYATAHSGGATTLYGGHPTSHHMTLPHYCTAPGQEYYTTAPPQQLLPPPHHMHHVYKATPHGQGSPETGGDGLESIENGKSESGSWKEGSSENEGERKGFVEESNGSEITLKF
ncbi:myb family transcription factor EFM-like [Vicia villosa]|uniref:myb family transcription factor EFM-like n=1 Tax=Vicia villosa TaxID=3911 RepID=UPI00273AF302|nr:myb family transcription factor EFM-like [Vicia villosa]